MHRKIVPWCPYQTRRLWKCVIVLVVNWMVEEEHNIPPDRNTTMVDMYKANKETEMHCNYFGRNNCYSMAFPSSHRLILLQSSPPMTLLVYERLIHLQWSSSCWILSSSEQLQLTRSRVTIWCLGHKPSKRNKTK